MSGYLNWAVRSIADVEVQMTAVQRVYEYATIAPEQQASAGWYILFSLGLHSLVKSL